MDPFEVRIQFLALLKRLNASQQSIQKVVGFAVKYFPPCGEDLWDCIVEECQKGSINSRINILYFLDSLCETCLLVKSHSSSIGSDPGNKQYVDFDEKAFPTSPAQNRRVVALLLYFSVTYRQQILENWRSKRVVDPQTVDDVLSALGKRTPPVASQAPGGISTDAPKIISFLAFSFRERRWVQPISHRAPGPMNMLSFLPLTGENDDEVLAVDVEFENDWETTSDWNEDDDEAAADESELCFPAEGEGPMDLS
ncbi:CID domain-containing protein [Mycena venus]|uniref:CID domain-containing protein n=1 Tax=Mycena venus TaxID=2733690 RepID=A0A8H6YW34_9AGAR|nr:CID domain-containing protein [Mycena venus]